MKAVYWTDTVDDPDRRKRKQAEFIVYSNFPWEYLEKIAWINIR